MTRLMGAVSVGITVCVIAACGGGEPASSPNSDPVSTSSTTLPGQTTTIRLALSPDPIWEYLKSSGAVERWEDVGNIRIDTVSTFDQFSAFAGGHVDMVVINALDVPSFSEQSEVEPAIVGKLNIDHSILAVPRTTQAETLEDLAERRIAVEASLGSTQMWGLIAEALHDNLDFRFDSDDFELVAVEPSSIADVVMRGDVDACICMPDFSAAYLAEGRLRPLYDGRSASEIYADEVLGNPGKLPFADAFVADRQWYEQNRTATKSLLDMWQEGVEHWSQNRAQMIETWPHLFHVREDAEISWLTDYANDHNWMVPTVYINEQEAQDHTNLVSEMMRIGLIPESSRLPEVYVADNSTDEIEG